jgi:N-acetylglucosaminyl-diphospho-decaprenol L-rhamnosyltransferase
MTIENSADRASSAGPDSAETVSAAGSSLGIVLLTYNCERWITRTADRLAQLDYPVVAVDNGSRDDTVRILSRYPQFEVIRLERNIGAAARNHAVRRLATDYVAFCDDDCWYEPAGLAFAAELLDRNPQLGLVNARILVRDECRLDPISALMQASPLPDVGALGGAPLASFMAGASIIRTSAYLQAGGYDPRFFIGGEEETLAYKLIRAGWQLRYRPEVVLHHYPSVANVDNLRHYGVRNTLVNAWLHRRLRSALRWSWFIVTDSPKDLNLLRGVAMALLALPWILAERRPMSPELDELLSMLDRHWLRNGRATPRRASRRGRWTAHRAARS